MTKGDWASRVVRGAGKVFTSLDAAGASAYGKCGYGSGSSSD